MIYYIFMIYICIFYVFQITHDFKAYICYLKYIENTDNSTHKPPRFNIFSLSIVLVSQGCCNKLSQISWLNYYSYSRSPKSRCQQSWFFPGRLRERIFAIPLWRLPANIGVFCLLSSSKDSVSPWYPWVLHTQSQLTADRKIFRKKKNFWKVSEIKTLICHTAHNYIHNIQIVFTTIYIVLDIISNLEMIKSILAEDVYRLYANATPFYVRDLTIPEFGQISRRPWNQISVDTEGRLYLSSDLGPTQNQDLKILILISSTKTLFPNRDIFSGFWWNTSFEGWGHCSTHYNYLP